MWPRVKARGHKGMLCTLPMSRSFRTLALSVAMLWALVPQLACFMPDQMTETEQQCCKEMANDCGGSGVSQLNAAAPLSVRMLERWPR